MALEHVIRPLKRVRYFSGQILTDADFETEQQYFRERLRLHNRHLHGWGVVSGLQVSVSPDASGGGPVVSVEPGYALDCLGEELLVPERIVSPLTPLPSGSQVIHLCALLVERETDFLPLPAEDSGQRMAASRIEEAVMLTFESADPCAGHGSRAGDPRGRGCGLRHGITLARLRKGPRGWRQDRRFRVRRLGKGS